MLFCEIHRKRHLKTDISKPDDGGRFEVVKQQKGVHFLAYFWKYSKTHCYKALSMLIKIQVKLRCIICFFQHLNALPSKFWASKNMKNTVLSTKHIF